MTIAHTVTMPDELKLAMERMDELIAAHPDIAPGTPEGEELEALIQTALRYESEA